MEFHLYPNNTRGDVALKLQRLTLVCGENTAELSSAHFLIHHFFAQIVPPLDIKTLGRASQEYNIKLKELWTPNSRYDIFKIKGEGAGEDLIAYHPSLEHLNSGLRHSTEPMNGQVILLKFPEAEKHPIKQRELAREIAKLVGRGAKVLMFTHSQDIIQELNTCIMMNLLKDEPEGKQALDMNPSLKDCHLSAEGLNVYSMYSSYWDPTEPGEDSGDRTYFHQEEVDTLLGFSVKSMDDLFDNSATIKDLLYVGVENYLARSAPRIP